MKRSISDLESEAPSRDGKQRSVDYTDPMYCVVIVLTPDLRIVAWNQVAERIYGWPRSEALGQDFVATFLPAHAQDDMRVAVRDILNGVELQTFEVEAVHRTGHSHVLYIGLHPLAGEPNHAPQILLIGQLAIQPKFGKSKLPDDDERLRRLSAHQDALVEAERTRIAREIHDELGATITGINMQLQMALAADADIAPKVRARLIESVGLIGTAQQSLQRIIAELRPSVLDHLGIWSSLEWLASQWQARIGLSCLITIEPVLAEYLLDDEHATTMFRIAQESLTNVARHANATRVDIRARIEGDVICLTIQDDGKGIEAGHLLDLASPGLLGMHERARRIGADLRISGEAGRGTLVSLRLPLPF
jgi:PAS domain S-box-containing protein